MKKLRELKSLKCLNISDEKDVTLIAKVGMQLYSRKFKNIHTVTEVNSTGIITKADIGSEYISSLTISFTQISKFDFVEFELEPNLDIKNETI